MKIQKKIYLNMLRDGYLFTFDRDILIACLTDLTYMYAPGDDVNKDAVIELLVLDTDELDDDDDDDDDEEEAQVLDDTVNRTINFPPGVDSSIEPIVNRLSRWYVTLNKLFTYIFKTVTV